MRVNYKCRLFLKLLGILYIYTTAAYSVSAQTGFYADLAVQYLSNTLEGAAKDKVQGVEPALNIGFRFFDNLGAGVFTNVSLGYYNVFGDISEYSINPRNYENSAIKAYPVYRFDIQPYLYLSKTLAYWAEAGIGIGPEISIYQYMFDSLRVSGTSTKSSREMVGTQSFSIGLMPQIQFTIYDHIVFGFRIHWVPFTLNGRSAYVYHFSNDKNQGYKLAEKEGIEVQNHFIKFGIFAGYHFGKTYYRSNYEYR